MADLHRIVGLCGAGLVFVTATCGGLAVLDGPGDGNGTGGGNASAGSSTRASTTQGPVSVVSSTGGPTNCDQACSALYDCGLQSDANGMQLCQGFTGAFREKSQFVMDCVDTCNTNPALLSLIDPSDCRARSRRSKASARTLATCATTASSVVSPRHHTNQTQGFAVSIASLWRELARPRPVRGGRVRMRWMETRH